MTEPPILIACSFSCGACGEPAAEVTLIPAGLPHPHHADAASLDAGLDRIGIDMDRLAIRGGPWPYTVTVRATGAVRRAVQAADAAALYAVDCELAPFWCPECRAAYCGSHWTAEVRYDDGFFDDVVGWCPVGHRRLLVD